MGLYCRGDCHGDLVSAFSYRKHPELRNIKNSTFVICGDIGVPFGISAPYYYHKFYKHDLYQLSHLQNKLEENDNTVICVLGNHDDRIAALRMVLQDKDDPRFRIMSLGDNIYENILVVTSPAVIQLPDNREKIFCIPGGTSHDAEVILNPNFTTFIKDIKREKREKKYLWRIKDWEWWEDEVVNVEATMKVTQSILNAGIQIDYIFSHEAPAMIHKWFKRPGWPGRQAATDGEKALQEVYNTLPAGFDWFHGHYHFDNIHDMRHNGYIKDKNLIGVYNHFFNVTERTWLD